MAQFDIYCNNNPASMEIIPYLLDVQHDLHCDLNTRLVIPLVRNIRKSQRIPKLCPEIVFNSEELTLSAPEMGAYSLSGLGDKRGSLAEYRAEIVAAIDFLLGGF